MKIDDLVYFMHNNTIQEAEIKEIRAITYKNPETNKIDSKVILVVSAYNLDSYEVNANDCFTRLDDIVEHLKKNYNKYLPF